MQRLLAPQGVITLEFPHLARLIAEGVVADAKQNWQMRIQYFFLLRAVGDQVTLDKLEKLERANESPRVSEVRNRTAWFIKQRLSLENLAERDRWRGAQVATGGSSLSTSLANCSTMPAS